MIPGPRWTIVPDRFVVSPFACLAELRRAYGDAVAVTEGVSLFGSALPLAGCFALFGARYNEVSLSDEERFLVRTPRAVQENANQLLRALSRGLTSMRGEVHRERREYLAPLFGVPQGHAALLASRCVPIIESWDTAAPIFLLAEMRRLAYAMLGSLMNADPIDAAHDSFGTAIEGLIRFRRRAALGRDPGVLANAVAAAEVVAGRCGRGSRVHERRAPLPMLPTSRRESPIFVLRVASSRCRRTRWSRISVPFTAPAPSQLPSHSHGRSWFCLSFRPFACVLQRISIAVRSVPKRCSIAW